MFKLPLDTHFLSHNTQAKAFSGTVFHVLSCGVIFLLRVFRKPQAKQKLQMDFEEFHTWFLKLTTETGVFMVHFV